MKHPGKEKVLLWCTRALSEEVLQMLSYFEIWLSEAACAGNRNASVQLKKVINVRKRWEQVMGETK